MYKAFANCLRYSSSASSKIITPSVGGLVFSGWGLGLETDRPRNFFENRKTAFKVTPTEKPPKIMIETACSQTWNHQAWYCTKRRVLFICFSVESVASTFQLTITHRLPHVDFSQKRLLNVQNAYSRQNLIWVYKLIFPSTSRYREDDSNLQIYFFFFFLIRGRHSGRFALRRRESELWRFRAQSSSPPAFILRAGERERTQTRENANKLHENEKMFPTFGWGLASSTKRTKFDCNAGLA